MHSLRQRRVPPKARLWQVYHPLGHPTAFGSVAAGPIALLAGFSLAALVTNLIEIEAGHRTLWADAGALAFASSLFALLLALRLVLEAQHWSVTPDELLGWYPEATISEAELNEVREIQAEHFFTYTWYRERALRWVPIGTSAAVIGLTFVAIHATAGRPWSRAALSGVLTAAAVVSFLARWDRPRFLVPGADDVHQALDREVAAKYAARAATQGAPSPRPRPQKGLAFQRSKADVVGLAAVLQNLADDDADVLHAAGLAALARQAEDRGVASTFRALVERLSPHFSQRHAEHATLMLSMDHTRLVGVHLTGHDPGGGVLMSVDVRAWAAAAGIDPTAVEAALTGFIESPDDSGRWFRFVRDPAELDALLTLLPDRAADSGRSA